MKQILIFAVALFCGAAGMYFYLKGEDKMTDLSQTEPEYAAMWDNFINKDVKTHGSLDVKTRWLVVLASHIATQSVNAYKVLLNQALDDGVSPTEIKETVYQTVPYAGMAKAYDFITASNEVLKARGIQLPLKSEATTTPETRLEQGIAVQTAIFGETIPQMRQNAPQNLKHIQDYLSANCFGDNYTRTGLSLQMRELLTFVTIISMGGADAQAKAHAQGNINVGNHKDYLIDVITQLVPYIGYPRTLNALAAVNAAEE